MTDTGIIRGTFKFLQWQDLYNVEKPFQVLTQIPPEAEDQRLTNLVFKEIEVDVEDVRNMPRPPTTDSHGFMYRTHHTNFTDFHSRQAVEQQYLPEVERLIKKEIDGVVSVFIFDWRLRNTLPEAPPGTVLDFNDRTSWLRPAVHFHVDQSPAGALNRVMLQLKDQAHTLLKSRVRIINVWRPLVDIIGDWALALCDGSTANEDHFVETDHIRRQYTGSSLYMMKKPSQKFHYMSRHTRDDVLFLKIFDSKKGVQAPSCPHASFKLPYEEPGGLPRQSIEVRCLVFDSKEIKPPQGYHQQVRREKLVEETLQEISSA